MLWGTSTKRELGAACLTRAQSLSSRAISPPSRISRSLQRFRSNYFLPLVAKLLLILLCLLSPIALIGCASVDKRVEKLTAEGKFEAALQELDEQGVGKSISQKPEPTPEALRARDIYQKAAETEFAKQVDASLRAGLARRAVEVVATGVRLCPWSEQLVALEQDSRTRIASIEAIQAQLEYSLTTRGDRALRREALLALRPYDQLLNDSPTTINLRKQAQDTLLADALSVMPTTFAPQPADREMLCNDLLLAGVDKRAVNAASLTLDSLLRMTEGATLESANVAALQEGMTELLNHAPLRRVADGTMSVFDSWANQRAQKPVPVHEATLGLLTALQGVKDIRATNTQHGVNALVVTILTTRAYSLQIDPKTAPLAWLYLEQARSLSPDSTRIDVELSRALGAIPRAEPFKASIAIDLDSTIDPSTHELLYMSIYDSIVQSSRKGVEWNWVDAVHGKPQIRIEVSEGQLFIPNSSDLIAKVSSYLSHYESVPNPRKEFLERQLSSQKISVSIAESSYESAVSSHNIYPTDWSLIGVNSARTRYVMAVDQYNNLVREYNATPDTVSQPVHVPYTYREGIVRAGLRTTGAIWVGDQKTDVQRAEVVSDNFRIGTKYNDIRESSRRDDPLEIEIDGGSQLRRIMTVARGWVNELDRDISRLPEQSRIELPSDEALLLRWLTGPFGPKESTAKQLGISPWAVQVGLQFRYPEQATELPTIHVENSVMPNESDQIIQFAVEASCEVITSSLTAARVHQGSGALISADGLILTCAHVLAGPQIHVRFFEGPLRGEHEAEIVRIDERSDVALIRAKGVTTNRWLSISDQSVERGTKIAAISSPSLDAGAVAHAAVTQGEVVTPIAEDWGQPRLVADLAVASGSSGGPVIDLKTGRIIGIVTAVSAIEFNEARASTATFCLAAPASRLSEWLGLVVRPKTP
jgi:hypothetical protein